MASLMDSEENYELDDVSERVAAAITRRVPTLIFSA
jgi:hypothetical protein